MDRLRWFCGDFAMNNDSSSNKLKGTSMYIYNPRPVLLNKKAVARAPSGYPKRLGTCGIFILLCVHWFGNKMTSGT